MPSHALPDGEVRVGHVLDALAEMPAESVQMCVTSPPYWSLRVYQGDQVTSWSDGDYAYGMEPTPALWAAHTLEWLRAVKRVLRRDGTVWLNVGSSYSGGGRGDSATPKQASNTGSNQLGRTPKLDDYKPLDLIDPFANLYPGLLADGWYVRSVVVWAKPNPMPESMAGWSWRRHRILRVALAKDLDNEFDEEEWIDCPGCPKCAPNDGLVLRRGSWRPTSSYEYITMLAKSANYYADGEGVREPHSEASLERYNYSLTINRDPAIKGSRHERFWAGFDGDKMSEHVNPSGRNLRDVWRFPTQPYSGAHFATFPEELVRRCILASTPDAGVCSVCGAPWARVLERKAMVIARSDRDNGTRIATSGTMVEPAESQTIGWRPTCSHDAPVEPAVCLDPFLGSGTTAVVARSLGRRFVGIELSEAYAEMALERLAETPPVMVLA